MLLYHKPAGEIVSADDPDGRPTVFEHLPRLKGGRWIAVGRLDFTSSGLLIFTTSGELAAQLMHPRYGFEREYAVRVDGTLATGGNASGSPRGFCSRTGRRGSRRIEDAGGRGRNHWYRVVLKEGRNREVRRMFEALGRTVSRLMRVRYGPLALPPGLKRGQVRELAPGAVAALLAEVEGAPVQPHPESLPKAPPAA